MGAGDLYISYKTENDTWTKAVSMGESINSDKHELCPYVTHDNRYLFYTSNNDIYRVSGAVIEQIRKDSL